MVGALHMVKSLLTRVYEKKLFRMKESILFAPQIFQQKLIIINNDKNFVLIL
jgi:hypothetical protein